MINNVGIDPYMGLNAILVNLCQGICAQKTMSASFFCKMLGASNPVGGSKQNMGNNIRERVQRYRTFTGDKRVDEQDILRPSRVNSCLGWIQSGLNFIIVLSLAPWFHDAIWGWLKTFDAIVIHIEHPFASIYQAFWDSMGLDSFDTYITYQRAKSWQPAAWFFSASSFSLALEPASRPAVFQSMVQWPLGHRANFCFFFSTTFFTRKNSSRAWHQSPVSHS